MAVGLVSVEADTVSVVGARNPCDAEYDFSIGHRRLRQR